MNTVIVPVDFSETSLHAAKYAAQLLVGHYGVTLILYHVIQKQLIKLLLIRIWKTSKPA